MICHPSLVTLDIGHRSIDRHAKIEPLCIDEMLSLIGELADLGVERMRFLLHDVEAIDDHALDTIQELSRANATLRYATEYQLRASA